MELDSSSSIPLYKQLINDIKKDIQIHKLNPGDKIPTEIELGSKYNVSRVTVRRAIAELVEEGLLLKSHGKGTFIAEKKIESYIKDLVGFSEMSRRHGIEITTKVISLDIVTGNSKSKKFFKWKEDESGEELKLIQFKRLRSYMDMPIILETTYMPTNFSFLIEEDLSGSLYEILNTKRSIYPTTDLKSFEICYANSEEVKYLNVESSAAMILSYDYVKDQYDEPLHITKQVIRGNNYRYVIQL